MSKPLVSIIVPTKNSAATLEACLKSCREQTYDKIELIVVDNFSTDDTKAIAEKYADEVFSRGPERSAQVNYGVEKANGEYIYKVDSDFILELSVVEECLVKVRDGYDAVVVHNSPDVRVSWIARIRKFEVDMYKYDLHFSSARFVKKSTYIKIGGFNPDITAGEDFDFQNKLNKANVKTGFIDAEALHLGEPTDIIAHLIKYFQYGRDFVNYQRVNKSESKTQLSPARGVYFKNYKKFINRPILGLEFILYTFAKFAAGGLGYTTATLGKNIMGRRHEKKAH